MEIPPHPRPRLCLEATASQQLQTRTGPNVSRSVKLLLAFANTVIHRFSLLEIHDQNVYSLIDMYVFQNGASSSTKEGVGLSM
jgi:hypothetical protein